MSLHTAHSVTIRTNFNKQGIMNFTLKIWRQRDAHSKGEFKEYKVTDISSDTSFLEMLDILNNDLVH